MAIVKMTKHTTPKIKNSFQPNFNQVVYSTFANAKPPIIAPDVGVNRFTKPLPALKIIVMTSGENPSSLAKPPMMGMDTVAIPDEDGIRNDSTT